MIESREITDNKERLKKCLKHFPYKRGIVWGLESRFWRYANKLRKLDFDIVGDYSRYSNEYVSKKYGIDEYHIELLPSVSPKFKKGREFNKILHSKILRRTIPSRANNLEINFV